MNIEYNNKKQCWQWNGRVLKSFAMSYELLYAFMNIKRYSIRTKALIEENNLEHSAMVAIILLRLMHKYDYKHSNLLAWALFHDAGELMTGDVNTLSKSDALRAELSKLEKPLMDNIQDYFGLTKLSIMDEELLKASDALASVFYGRINNIGIIRDFAFAKFKKHLRKFLKLHRHSLKSMFPSEMRV